uniref:Uncharacterized protein n=1 Tax=Anguilla anguilla TaxID=7936 RepID=A0A0E9QB34_ANGAN
MFTLCTSFLRVFLLAVIWLMTALAMSA